MNPPCECEHEDTASLLRVVAKRQLASERSLSHFASVEVQSPFFLRNCFSAVGLLLQISLNPLEPLARLFRKTGLLVNRIRGKVERRDARVSEPVAPVGSEQPAVGRNVDEKYC